MRGALVPELVKWYPEARARIESGKLAVTELVSEVTAYDLAAHLLARYTTDRPAELAELAAIADPRHYKEFASALMANKAAAVPVLMLKAELAKGVPDARTDREREAVCRRRGHAAAALVALGEGEAVWSVFRFPSDGDPTARSYLLSRLSRGRDRSAGGWCAASMPKRTCRRSGRSWWRWATSHRNWYRQGSRGRSRIGSW